MFKCNCLDRGNKVYLDANATTLCSEETKTEMLRWINMGNASGVYDSANECKDMIELFRKQIARVCKFSLEDYHIVFNSGASEANATIIRCLSESYLAKTTRVPHIIASEYEHKTTIDLLLHLRSLRVIEFSLVKPTPAGFITAAEVGRFVKENTALITIMHANNELGNINNITAIANMARREKIPFHTDATQTFGKIPPDFSVTHIDALSISFHKMYGPPGVGALIIRKDLVAEYEMGPLVAGTQNEGLRGGTENVIGLAGAFHGFHETLKARTRKNAHLVRILKYAKEKLSNTFDYYDYKPGMPLGKTGLRIYQLSPNAGCLPNTILFSIYSPENVVCNKKIKEYLCKVGVIIGTGSACNTGRNISHVLDAIGLPDELTKGVIRVSFMDCTTTADIDRFVKMLVKVINYLLSQPKIEEKPQIK